jgi:inorganic pyrophosphatase
MILTVCVEMPQNTVLKMEHDKVKDYIKVDRLLNQPVPYNYGYIEGNNLCEDGDPIDCFILGDVPISSLVRVQVEVIGVLKCVDNGERDDKLVGVIIGDFNGFRTIGISEITRYLETYKEGFIVEGYFGTEEAEKVYQKSVELYKVESEKRAKVKEEERAKLLGKTFPQFTKND